MYCLTLAECRKGLGTGEDTPAKLGESETPQSGYGLLSA